MQYFENNEYVSLISRGLGQFPHALLIHGPAGVGKRECAEHIATLLLCEAPTASNASCGACQSCRWRASAQHPDFRRISPGGDEDAGDGATEGGAAEKTKKRAVPLIRIDQIRDLEEFVFRGSHRHGRRVVLITDAETMNPSAANALLKILEEPPEGVFFLLVASQLRALLPTIRSRCRSLTLNRPEAGAATAWLKALDLGKEAEAFLDLAGGAPRQVAQWREDGMMEPLSALISTLKAPPADPLVLAGQWDGLLRGEGAFRLEHLVVEVQRWLFDLITETTAGRVRYHRGWPRPAAASPPAVPRALIDGWRELLRFRRSARHPLNQLLFLEDLATHFLRALRPPRGA